MTNHEQKLIRIAHLKAKLALFDTQVDLLDEKLIDFQQSVADLIKKAKEEKQKLPKPL